MIAGAIVGLVSIGLAIYYGTHGHDVVAIIFGLLAMIVTIIMARKSKIL